MQYLIFENNDFFNVRTSINFKFIIHLSLFIKLFLIFEIVVNSFIHFSQIKNVNN